MTALTHPGRLPPGFLFASSSCLGIKSHLTYVCWMYMLWTHFGYTSATRHLHDRCGCALVQARVCPCPCPCLYLFCMHTAASERRPIANCRTYRMGGHLPTMSFSFSLVWEQCGSGTIFTPALSHSERALFRPFYPDYTVVA